MGDQARVSQWKFITGTEIPMAVIPTITYDGYFSPFREAFASTAIDKLRRQRKADCKPKKPKPVTDEQLLAIVDELEAKIKKLTDDLASAIERGTDRIPGVPWWKFWA